MSRPATHEWLRPPQGTDTIPVGTLVRDTATGRVGVLMDVFTYTDGALPGPDANRPQQRLAFVRPIGGGREWSTNPDQIRPEPTEEETSK